MSGEVSLLVADALDLFDQGFVDFNLTSVFGLHHLKNFEFDEVVVRIGMCEALLGWVLFLVSLFYETAVQMGVLRVRLSQFCADSPLVVGVVRVVVLHVLGDAL